MIEVLTGNQIEELDKKTIDEIGIPGIVLMENAGLALYQSIINERLFKNKIDPRVSIICGTGNNGGDGFVLARHLFNNEIDVNVYILGSKEKIKGDALINYKIIEKLGLVNYEILAFEEIEYYIEYFQSSDLIVDAIFGTGLKPPIKGFIGDVINFINSLDKKILSVDIPSGLSASHSNILGESIKADYTVTFAYPKICNVIYPAAINSGKLIIKDISIPDSVLSGKSDYCSYVSSSSLFKDTLDIPINAYKNQLGHLLILGGSVGYEGAPILASKAASKTGVGLISLLVPDVISNILSTNLIEEMVYPIKSESGKYSKVIIEELNKFIEEKGIKSILIGPGLGMSETNKELVKNLIKNFKGTICIDADGLNNVVGNLNLFKERPYYYKNIILTPHPGEAAKLLNCSNDEIQSDRLKYIKELSELTNCIVILKGPGTLISTSSKRVYINSNGNSGMAKGGSGDVLAGVIGGFLARGIDPNIAAIMGVYSHGKAGDLASKEFGITSMKPSNIIEQLNKVFELIRNVK